MINVLTFIKTKYKSFKINKIKEICADRKTNKQRQDIKKSRYKLYKQLASVLKSKCPKKIKSDARFQKRRTIYRANVDYKTEVILCYHLFKNKVL